jgi:hypothetical protein
MLFFTFLVLVYYIKARPFEEQSKHRTELLNEITILLSTSMIPIFMALGEDSAAVEISGYVFIGIAMGNILFHLVLIIRDTCLQIKQLLRKCCVKKERIVPEPKRKGRILAPDAFFEGIGGPQRSFSSNRPLMTIAEDCEAEEEEKE